VQLDGARSLVTGVAPGNVVITYILNEPATLGTTIAVTSGSNLVRVLTAPPGANGALMGSNLFVWDGNNSNGIAVPTGNYLITITPAAAGYTNWTQISHDTNPGNYVFDPRGLAVDNNSNSLFCGRIFVGNAGAGPHPETVPGDRDTILKLNADGTFPGDGTDGTGGFDGIYDDGYSDVPLKMRVADDDLLYMNDLTEWGEVVSFDPTLNSYQVVLDQNNYTQNPFAGIIFSSFNGWFSMDITGAGTTNGLVWLGDNDLLGAGIWNWHLTNGVADPNDQTGNWAVAAALGGPLSVAASGGLMVDANMDIFVGQYLLTNTGDTNAQCMVFTNWNDGMAFNGEAVTNGTGWTAGTNDNNFLGVFDTTIDSRQHPKYVACALNGGPVTNGIRILDALTGTNVVANLDATNQYFVTAWDSVGNLYAAAGAPLHRLRVFSPPAGTNQTSTTALMRVVPIITGFTDDGTNVTVKFTGSKSDSASEFVLQNAGAVEGPFTNILSATVTQLAPGSFTVSTPVNPTNGPAQFYMIGVTLAP